MGDFGPMKSLQILIDFITFVQKIPTYLFCLVYCLWSVETSRLEEDRNLCHEDIINNIRSYSSKYLRALKIKWSTVIAVFRNYSLLFSN